MRRELTMRERVLLSVAVLLSLLAMASGAGAQIGYQPDGDSSYSIGAAPKISVSFLPFQWYVDSVRGSDANTGTSAAAPLQTLAALMGKTITAGQRVGLKRGSVWREQLTIPSAGGSLTAPIVYDTYGSGPRPKIIASDVIPGPWAVHAGSIYVADVVGMWDAGAAWVATSTVLVKAANLAGLTAAGQFFPDIAAAKFYVWLPDSSDPTGQTIEAQRRTYGVLCTKRWVWLRNLSVRHANRGISFENGAPISQGSYVSDSDVSDCYGQGLYSEIWTLTVQSTVFTGIWNGKVYGAGGGGSAIRIVGANGLDNIVRYNTVNDSYVGIDTTTSKGARVYRNVVLSAKVNGIGAGSADMADPALIYHNAIYHNPAWQDGHGIEIGRAHV